MVFDADELGKIKGRPNTPKSCWFKVNKQTMNLLDFSPAHQPLEAFVYDGSVSPSANLRKYLEAISNPEFNTLEPELKEEFTNTLKMQLLTELPCVGTCPDGLGLQETRCSLYGIDCNPIIGFTPESIFPLIIPVKKVIISSLFNFRGNNNPRSTIN